MGARRRRHVTRRAGPRCFPRAEGCGRQSGAGGGGGGCAAAAPTAAPNGPNGRANGRNGRPDGPYGSRCPPRAAPPGSAARPGAGSRSLSRLSPLSPPLSPSPSGVEGAGCPGAPRCRRRQRVERGGEPWCPGSPPLLAGSAAAGRCATAAAGCCCPPCCCCCCSPAPTSWRPSLPPSATARRPPAGTAPVRAGTRPPGSPRPSSPIPSHPFPIAEFVRWDAHRPPGWEHGALRRQEMGEKAENWGLVGWESEPAAHPEPLLLLLAWEVHQRELKLMLRVRVSRQICWVLLGETKAGSWGGSARCASR